MSKDDKSPEEFNGITFTDCKSEGNGGAGFFFGKGVKAKLDNCEANDNGGGGFVTEGEHKIPTINRIALAIKKPRANNNKGLKIIIGFVLTCIIAPLIVGVSLEFWKEHRATTNQEQPQSIQLQEVSGSDQI